MGHLLRLHNCTSSPVTLRALIPNEGHPVLAGTQTQLALEHTLLTELYFSEPSVTSRHTLMGVGGRPDRVADTYAEVLFILHTEGISQLDGNRAMDILVPENLAEKLCQPVEHAGRHTSDLATIACKSGATLMLYNTPLAESTDCVLTVAVESLHKPELNKFRMAMVMIAERSAMYVHLSHGPGNVYYYPRVFDLLAKKTASDDNNVLRAPQVFSPDPLPDTWFGMVVSSPSREQPFSFDDEPQTNQTVVFTSPHPPRATSGQNWSEAPTPSVSHDPWDSTSADRVHADWEPRPAGRHRYVFSEKEEATWRCAVQKGAPNCKRADISALDFNFGKQPEHGEALMQQRYEDANMAPLDFDMPMKKGKAYIRPQTTPPQSFERPWDADENECDWEQRNREADDAFLASQEQNEAFQSEHDLERGGKLPRAPSPGGLQLTLILTHAEHEHFLVNASTVEAVVVQYGVCLEIDHDETLLPTSPRLDAFPDFPDLELDQLVLARFVFRDSVTIASCLDKVFWSVFPTRARIEVRLLVFAMRGNEWNPLNFLGVRSRSGGVWVGKTFGMAEVFVVEGKRGDVSWAVAEMVTKDEMRGDGNVSRRGAGGRMRQSGNEWAGEEMEAGFGSSYEVAGCNREKRGNGISLESRDVGDQFEDAERDEGAANKQSRSCTQPGNSFILTNPIPLASDMPRGQNPCLANVPMSTVAAWHSFSREASGGSRPTLNGPTVPYSVRILLIPDEVDCVGAHVDSGWISRIERTSVRVLPHHNHQFGRPCDEGWVKEEEVYHTAVVCSVSFKGLVEMASFVASKIGYQLRLLVPEEHVDQLAGANAEFFNELQKKITIVAIARGYLIVGGYRVIWVAGELRGILQCIERLLVRYHEQHEQVSSNGWIDEHKSDDKIGVDFDPQIQEHGLSARLPTIFTLELLVTAVELKRLQTGPRDFLTTISALRGIKIRTRMHATFQSTELVFPPTLHPQLAYIVTLSGYTPPLLAAAIVDIARYLWTPGAHSPRVRLLIPEVFIEPIDNVVRNNDYFTSLLICRVVDTTWRFLLAAGRFLDLDRFIRRLVERYMWAVDEARLAMGSEDRTGRPTMQITISPRRRTMRVALTEKDLACLQPDRFALRHVVVGVSPLGGDPMMHVMTLVGTDYELVSACIDVAIAGRAQTWEKPFVRLLLYKAVLFFVPGLLWEVKEAGVHVYWLEGMVESGMRCVIVAGAVPNLRVAIGKMVRRHREEVERRWYDVCE